MHADNHPERYWLTYTFAVLLTVIVAAYGAWGWLQAHEPFKAILCLVAQGLANGNAVLARRAFAKERPAMGLAALALGVGCGAWSAISLHHAWTLDGSEIHWTMTAFLALLEPVMFWFVEEVKLAKKPKTPEELADEALAGLRAAPAHEPKSARAHLRSIAGGLTGSLAVAVSPSAQAHEPSRFPTSEPIDPKPMSQRMSRAELRNLTEPNRAEARLMLRQGQGPTAVHRATGVPISTLKRWAKEAA